MPILIKSFIGTSPEELEIEVNSFIMRIGGERVDSVQFLTPCSAGSGCSNFAAFVTYYGETGE